MQGFLALLLLSLTLLDACDGSLVSNDTPMPETPASTGHPDSTVTSAAPSPVAISPSVRDHFLTIRVDQLPPEARNTLAMIARGGPFPYRQDGVVFQNREGYLPSKPNGYYHEYTVETPGSSDRGARRIITGGGGEMYYTDDHYVTFKRIVQ